MKKSSAFSRFPSLRVRPVIVKHGDDIRQEIFAMHLIQAFERVFAKEKLALRLWPYGIVVCGKISAFIEYIQGSSSLSALKKAHHGASLYTIFSSSKNQHKLYQYRKNFTESLAAYSLVCHLINIKDRHNGNILIDEEANIIHIDFGYMISNFPGKILSIETSPFKLTDEYI